MNKTITTTTTSTLSLSNIVTFPHCFLTAYKSLWCLPVLAASSCDNISEKILPAKRYRPFIGFRRSLLSWDVGFKKPRPILLWHWKSMFTLWNQSPMKIKLYQFLAFESVGFLFSKFFLSHKKEKWKRFFFFS